MDWRVKGTIQKVLGYVPGGGELHYMLQRRAGGLTDFNRECDIKVDDWQIMMAHLRASKIPIEGATMLEMGTGWYPTFPFCFYLAGAARVYTLDLRRLVKRDMTTLLAARLETHVALIARESGRPEVEVQARQHGIRSALERGATLAAATDNVVEYRAPADAAKTGLPAESVDVLFSNSVLEHVPGRVIEACFAEAMRILRPGGILFHSVNCGDHYAYIDRRIHALHYLRFSERDWSRWNNAFLYQNRLRANDFTDMARRAGFEIEVDTAKASAVRLAQLDSIRVAPEFSRYSREQLAVTSVDFVGRKRARPA